ncbi:hypothetical protein PpBr36_04103 [Pyricularia pennisetigena]|uniref:hypothetical protein n=1 Tax=Pyricularia pennisetigena TaxID=1578925 RepID=UPI0011516201|nr:hypothetical protein PpBr36_04103 [Pyricularia pennisetigena]TLS27437.1 hypothetical protein PpBr36_04103 [Pyricularia pennisetigena]
MANQEDGGNAVFFSSSKYQLGRMKSTLLTSEPQPPSRQHRSRLRQMRSRLSWHGSFFSPAVTSPLPPLPDDRQYAAQDARPGVASRGKSQQENHAAARLDGSCSSPFTTNKPKLRIDTNLSAKQSQRPAFSTVTTHQAEVVNHQTSVPAKPEVFGLRRLLRRPTQAPMPRFSATSTAEEEYRALDNCIEEVAETTQVSQPNPAHHRLGTMQNHQPLVGNWDTSTAMHPPNPPPPLRKKSSMIDRLRVLRPRPSVQALDSQNLEHSSGNVAPYVPKHAASDFSRIRVNLRSRESTTLGGSLSSRSTREMDGRQALLADAPTKLWSIADQAIEDEPARVFRRRNTAYPYDQPDAIDHSPSDQHTRPSTPDLQVRSGDSPSPASTEYSLCRYDSGVVSPLSAMSPRDSQRYTTLDDAIHSSPLPSRSKNSLACKTNAPNDQQAAAIETPTKLSRAIISTPTTSPEEKFSSDYELFLENAAQKHQRQQEQLWHRLATPDGQVVYTTNTALNEDDPRWKRSAVAQPTAQIQHPQRYGGGGKDGFSLGGSSNNVFGQKEKTVENRRGGRGLGKRISQYLRPTRESNVWDEKVLRLNSRDV